MRIPLSVSNAEKNIWTIPASQHHSDTMVIAHSLLIDEDPDGERVPLREEARWGEKPTGKQVYGLRQRGCVNQSLQMDFLGVNERWLRLSNVARKVDYMRR